jgi:hypothetical protein
MLAMAGVLMCDVAVIASKACVGPLWSATRELLHDSVSHRQGNRTCRKLLLDRYSRKIPSRERARLSGVL